jgi:hypothetical protein
MLIGFLPELFNPVHKGVAGGRFFAGLIKSANMLFRISGGHSVYLAVTYTTK